MTETSNEVTASTESKPTLGRSADAWNYLYFFLGFTLIIEGIVVQMILPHKAPGNLLIYLVLGGVTFWLFLYNPGVQDALLKARERYESKR